MPLPVGLFKVIGCRDIMTGTKGRDSGLLLRLYYPAQDQGRDIRQQFLFWPNWLPHENYRKGYADVAQLTSPTAVKLINWLVGDAFIPCVMNAKPLSDGHKLPVIILSHGVGGCRSVSSSICLELASNGYLVAALEHRDGSACATFYANEIQIPMYRSNPDLALPTVDGLAPSLHTHPKVIETILEEDESDVARTESRRRDGRGKSFLPKTTTEWISFDRVDESSDEGKERREAQVKQRSQDCSRAVDLMQQLNAGEDISNVLDGLLDPREFHDLLDMQRVVVMGHSLGGTASLAAAAADPRFRVVVCLDACMDPIQKEAISLSQPVLFINTEKMQSKANLRHMSQLVHSQSDADAGERQVVTIRGSVHYNQTDVPFVLTHLAKLLFRGSGKRSPFTAHDLTCSLVISFLNDKLSLAHELPERKHFLKKQQRKLKYGFPKKL